MLQPKKLIILVGVVVIIVVASLYILKGDHCDNQKRFAVPGVHACLEQGDEPTILRLVNNTSDTILPAKDHHATQWRLLKKTNTGWQEFNYEFSAYELPGIDQPLLPYQTGEYRIYGLFTRIYFEPIISSDSGLQISTHLEGPGGGGAYMVEVNYFKQSPQGEEILVTYTNLFTYNQVNVGDETIAVGLQPQLEKRDDRYGLRFVVSNETGQDFWIRPFGLKIAGIHETLVYPDIVVMRQVDQTSWQSINQTWPILKQSEQAVRVGAGETRELHGIDLDTEFSIREPGTYRWIMPIYLEYFPEAKEPRLNQRRYLFSEEFEVK